MRRTSFNDAWEVRPKASLFFDMFGTGSPWTEVALPHDAMISGRRDPSGDAATGFYPGGTWDYRKVFFVPEAYRGKKVVLELEGVYRGAKVLVNGNLAGQRPFGYSGFFVDLGPYLLYGTGNEVHVEASVHEDSRWYPGAGIYRDTWLVVGEPVHVALDGLRVMTPDIDDELATVEVATNVDNDTTDPVTVTVITEILDAGGDMVATDRAPLSLFARTTATARQRLYVRAPRRWRLDDPHLYQCQTSLVVDGEQVDAERTTFGIRSLRADPIRGLRINDEPVKLRGACIHHDNGVIGAATFARAEERRVELLKDAGFNAIRSAHNPASRALLDACDRHGMLVMDEAFDMWTIAKSNDDYAGSFPEWWERDIEAMVAKDRNHPSVVLYSIGNEITELGTLVGRVWGRTLAERVRDLDPTRLVTNGINPLLACAKDLLGSGGDAGVAAPEPPAEAVGLNDTMTTMADVMAGLLRSEVVTEQMQEAFAVLDVGGYNYGESRYELDGELFPNRLLVGSETVPPQIDELWRQVTNLDHVLGDFTWTGWDYLGEAGAGRIEYEERATSGPMDGFLGSYPWRTAWTGDLDITGFRRPVSYFREIVFGLRSAPYIAVHRPEHYGKEPTQQGQWSTTDSVSSWSWNGHERRPVVVDVYADADEVELHVNGAVVGRAAAGAANRFQARFETTFEPGEIVAVAYRDGHEAERTSLRSARGDVCVDVAVDRSELTADGTDLAYVDITLVDADGNLYNTADREMSIVLDGPGVLQGFGSAAPRSEESFTGDRHTTFDGRAIAVVRPTGAGTIILTVSADGCGTRSVSFAAKGSVQLGGRGY